MGELVSHLLRSVKKLKGCLSASTASALHHWASRAASPLSIPVPLDLPGALCSPPGSACAVSLLPPGAARSLLHWLKTSSVIFRPDQTSSVHFQPPGPPLPPRCWPAVTTLRTSSEAVHAPPRPLLLDHPTRLGAPPLEPRGLLPLLTCQTQSQSPGSVPSLSLHVPLSASGPVLLPARR